MEYNKYRSTTPESTEQGKRWRAEEGEKYWFVDTMGDPTDRIEAGGFLSETHWQTGNYYRTHAEAKAASQGKRKPPQDAAEPNPRFVQFMVVLALLALAIGLNQNPVTHEWLADNVEWRVLGVAGLTVSFLYALHLYRSGDMEIPDCPYCGAPGDQCECGADWGRPG